MFACLFALGASLSATGCDRPRVVGRYASAACIDYREDPRGRSCDRESLDAEVSVVFLRTAPPPTPGLRGTGLPDHALASYVEVLSSPRFSGSAEALRRNLSESLEPGQTDPQFRDDSAVTGQITVTITNGAAFSPADRIDQATVRVTLRNASLSNWTAARTAYSEIRPGTITASRDTTLSGGLSVSPPAPVPLTATLNSSVTRRREEVVAPVFQVEDITVRIEPSAARDKANDVSGRTAGPDTLIVERNGGFTRDLRGNAQVEITMQPDPGVAREVEVFELSKGTANSRLNSRVRRILVGTVQADVSMDYVVRHVLTGDGTIEDGDDRVVFQRRRFLARSVPFVTGQTLYGLVRNDDVSRLFLQVMRDAGRPLGTELCFPDLGQAERLRDHLRRSVGGTIDSHPVGFIREGRLNRIAPVEIGNLRLSSGCGETRNPVRASVQPSSGT